MKHQMGRFERIASEMNAWLLAFAIGLGTLDLTVLVAKALPPLPQTPIAADEGYHGGAQVSAPAHQSHN